MLDTIRVTVIATGFDQKRRQSALALDEGGESVLPTAASVPTFEPITDDDLDIPAFLRRKG